MFPSMQIPPRSNENSRTTRTIEVEPLNHQDPDHLVVPGLKVAHSVRIGSAQLPDRIDYELPETGRFDRKLSISFPTWQVSKNHEGVPVLQRSIYSNDGKWQAGHTVVIHGEFEDDAAPAVEAPVDPKARK